MENQKIKRSKKFYKRWWFWVLMVFLLIIIAAASDDSSNNQSAENNVGQESQLSEEDQIKKLVSNELKGNNNMSKPYLRKIDVIEQANGGWGVFVEYNADDNLTTNLRKGSIESKMSEIYMALYTSEKNIQTASVTAYFPLIDNYGNENDGVVYKSILEKEKADNVNWDANKSLLKVDILPGLWETAILHQEFR